MPAYPAGGAQLRDTHFCHPQLGWTLGRILAHSLPSSSPCTWPWARWGLPEHLRQSRTPTLGPSCHWETRHFSCNSTRGPGPVSSLPSDLPAPLHHLLHSGMAGLAFYLLCTKTHPTGLFPQIDNSTSGPQPCPCLATPSPSLGTGCPQTLAPHPAPSPLLLPLERPLRGTVATRLRWGAAASAGKGKRMGPPKPHLQWTPRCDATLGTAGYWLSKPPCPPAPLPYILSMASLWLCLGVGASTLLRAGHSPPRP